MNILILTGKFGLGHYSAAEAIKEQLLLEDPTYQVTILDFFDYMFPVINHMIYGTFNFLVGKCHTIYNLFNDLTFQHATVPLKRVVVKKIDELLVTNDVDMVISVLPVCSQYISAYKKMFHKDIILNTFITDVTVHEEWLAEKTDCYFVGTERTKKFLLAKGVSEERIVVSGIPVKTKFKNQKKQPHEKKEILIMGGGLGLIPSLDKFLNQLRKQENIHITIIVGNNKKLYTKLVKKYQDLTIIGYTDQVHTYMNRADLIITKAGGITLFESIYTKTPLYVIKPFLSQELENAKYIEDHSIGQVAWHKKTSISQDIIDLVLNDSRLAEMRNNMEMVKAKLSEPSFAKRTGGV